MAGVVRPFFARHNHMLLSSKHGCVLFCRMDADARALPRQCVSAAKNSSCSFVAFVVNGRCFDDTHSKLFNRFDVPLSKFIRYAQSTVYPPLTIGHRKCKLPVTWSPCTSGGCACAHMKLQQKPPSKNETVHLILPDECVTGPRNNDAITMPNIADNPNDGVFFIDNSTFSENFLRQLTLYRQYRMRRYWEQSAMKTWRQDNAEAFRKHARIISHVLINECFSPCPKPQNYKNGKHWSKRFIIHWAGCGGLKWHIKSRMSIYEYLTENHLV